MTFLTSASSTLRRHGRPLLGLALVALALGGCSDVRRSIGLDRQSPDEFSVVSRAPLSIPPDLINAPALPAPRPGAPRPQAPNETAAAASAVFGKPAAAKAGESTGERQLIAEATARGGVDPNIRNKVDQETTDLAIADRGWVDSLLFWRKPEDNASLVDPKKEQQRIRQAEAQGKTLAGPVPTIERKRKAPLEGLF